MSEKWQALSARSAALFWPMKGLGVCLVLCGIAALMPAHAELALTEGTQASDARKAAAPVLSAELRQFLVVSEAGKEVFKPVSQVKPGDLIEYRVVYTNRSANVVRDVVAELPLPPELEYLPNSAKPRQGAQARVTGGIYGAEPLMREAAGGKKEPVPYADYRLLRWTLGAISAGGKAEVSARAKVASGSPVVAQTTQRAPAALAR
ncbi:MAG: hypothetical protein ACOYB1_11120 [Limnohabitans sp.]